jgi:hypothetical protein
MQKYQIIVLVLGLLAAIAVTLLGGEESIFLGLVILVIDLVLLMSFIISESSKKLKRIPKLTAHLTEDAKSVIIRNEGDRAAVGVHVALVPLNIEFNIPRIDAGDDASHPEAEMINEAKAVMTYQDEEGAAYTHSTHLTALGPDEEDDLLKPAFPMFKWK